jgi:hypothetical protein
MEHVFDFLPIIVEMVICAVVFGKAGVHLIKFLMRRFGESGYKKYLRSMEAAYKQDAQINKKYSY